MKTLLAAIDRAGGVLASLYMLLAAVALFALVPMAGWLVFGRYVLNASPTWVEATSLVLMLVLTFAVAAAATRSGDHLAILFLRDALPRPLERLMRAANYSLLTVFGAWMAAASAQNAIRTWSRDIPLLLIPEGVRHLPLVAGGAGIALFAAVHLFAMIVGADERETAKPASGDLPVE